MLQLHRLLPRPLASILDRIAGLRSLPEDRIATIPARFRVQQTHPDQVLSIPCPDPTGEDRERDRYLTRGQFLARQERWSELSEELRAADKSRLATPAGMPVADLLSFGARSDAVQAAEHALFDGRLAKDAPIMEGIEALERVLSENTGDYAIAMIVAQTHMDIGWAWRGTGWDVEVHPRNRAAFLAHFARAEEILEPHCGLSQDASALAAARCALLAGATDAQDRVADDYEDLIDLNPTNPGPMRAMGNYLLPRWFGSYAQLELEARRTAARTQDVWGAGGYTWVMFDAISADDMACAQLDLPFFIEGLHDIIRHNPHQHTINLLAAYCANTIGNAFSGDDAADHNRTQIAECAQWIIRNHLTELHPMIWAHAARGFDNNLRIRSAGRFAADGHADALRIIANLFRGEIAEGKRIVFTDDGPVAEAA